MNNPTLRIIGIEEGKKTRQRHRTYFQVNQLGKFSKCEKKMPMKKDTGSNRISKRMEPNP